MLRRKRTEDFNLAFLDIMACGLGAVILVFMLVKQNLDAAPSEIDRLKADIAKLEQAQIDATGTLGEVRANLATQSSRLQQKSQELDAQQSALASQQSAAEAAQSALAELKSNITEIEIPDRQDLIEKRADQ